MEWLEWVIKIGAAATALVALWKLVAAIVRLINNFIGFLKSVKSDITELKEHSKENYLGIKRLTVMSHDMPMGERIVAAHDYIKEGGNGDVKKYIKSELHIDDIPKD